MRSLRGAMLVALVGVLSASSFTALEAADPNATANPNQKFVKLLNIATGKVLSIDSNDNVEMNLIIAADDSDEIRQWSLIEDGEFLKIVNRKSGQFLDV